MSKKPSNARKQRRLYERYLKKTDYKKWVEWKSESYERGKSIQKQNRELIEKSLATQYEDMQSKMIESMRNFGRSEDFINSSIDEWVDGLEVWSNKR